ncbi:LacI family DNA-binding transcriptional regulator [Streptacidiphilus monticola]|uniref:LacI family DNA-binding transcriptional regulator n=1 Tax=Streptacidiphilus monticola TaxID=2161674 RepID=A0ABW1GAP2_9ACTN
MRRRPRRRPELSATRPTGRDVARLAGVSQATVSLVFSPGGPHGRVSDATRDRVLAAARELGYQPQAAARQLRLGRTGLLLLTVPNILGPFFARVLAGAQAAAAERGLSVVVSSGWDRETVAAAARSRQYDGLLVCSPDDAQLGAALPGDVPVVFLDADPALGRGLELDVAGGMAAAVRHLRDLGHRQLGRLRSTENAYTFRARQRGFVAAAEGWADVRELGVSINRGLPAARAAARDLLSSDRRPTAVVCDDDIVAAGVYHAAAELGLSIPDDLSVVGIDNIVAAALFAPALTTVDLPGERLGAEGVALLLDPDAPAPGPLPTTLVERSSTRRVG